MRRFGQSATLAVLLLVGLLGARTAGAVSVPANASLFDPVNDNTNGNSVVTTVRLDNSSALGLTLWDATGTAKLDFTVNVFGTLSFDAVTKTVSYQQGISGSTVQSPVWSGWDLFYLSTQGASPVWGVVASSGANGLSHLVDFSGSASLLLTNAAVVPIPPAALLFGVVMVGLTWVARRGSARPGAAAA